MCTYDIKDRLTTYELDCIRFYMGDSEIVERGDFRGGPKAYNTINALLHNGIQNEIDKIRDKKPIEIFDKEHLDSYLSLIVAIYRAMEKFCCIYKDSETTWWSPVTYRVDRFSEAASLFATKKLEGFYSTCKYGYLSSYAESKSDIVLFEIHRTPDVPWLDFEVLFGKGYAKPEEAEILLPFDARVKLIEEVSLSAQEKELYRDINGKPPMGKYKMVVEKQTVVYERKDVSEIVEKADILDENKIARVQKCLEELRRNQNLSEDDLAFYAEWKQGIKNYIVNIQEEIDEI